MPEVPVVSVADLQLALEARALREKLLLATLEAKDKQRSELLGALSQAEASLARMLQFEEEVRAAYDAYQTPGGDVLRQGVYDAILLLDGSFERDALESGRDILVPVPPGYSVWRVPIQVLARDGLSTLHPYFAYEASWGEHYYSSELAAIDACRDHAATKGT